MEMESINIGDEQEGFNCKLLNSETSPENHVEAVKKEARKAAN